jgi:hypothetical protein
MVRGLHPFFTEKFDIAYHPRYAMLDECDREHNTYYLEENLSTVKETEYVDMSAFFAEESEAATEKTVDIVFVSGDTDHAMTEQEMLISEKLRKFTGIYAI